MTVVNSAPISTTNMTGLRTISRGSSLRAEAATADFRIDGSNSECSLLGVLAGGAVGTSCTSVIAMPPGRGRG